MTLTLRPEALLIIQENRNDPDPITKTGPFIDEIRGRK